MLKEISIFLHFFEKTIPYRKILKILFQKDSSPHRSMCFIQNFVKFGRWEIGKIMHCLPDK